MDLDSVAHELYGLPLDEFVATRNARAKQARADGDRQAAADIQALAKPTTAAWLVNRLSRDRSDDLGPLLDLGRELRDASAKLDGEAMRTLGRQRNELISELLAAGRDIGKAQGNPVSDDVADEVRRTLEATLSDSAVADEVAAGRLTRAVEYAGFGEFGGLGGPTGIVGQPRRERPATRPPAKRSEPKPAKRASQPTDLTARRRLRAEQDAEEAAQRLETARSGRDEAAEEHERAAADVEAAETEVERLRAELTEAERAAKTARQAHRSAQQRLSNAEREVGGMERVYERANAKLDELGD